MLDSTTLFLFSPFEREVAIPSRQTIKGIQHFLDFIDINNGINDCYCDIFTYPFNHVINKIYFDIDGVIGGMEEALPYAQLFYQYLTEERNLNVIPVASGKKGFNLYVLLKEKKYDDAKDLLKKVSYSLITGCFGHISPVTYKDEEGSDHPNLAQVDEYGNFLHLICIDPRVIGDVRRFSRIPNTLRPPENRAYCTYLNPDKFKTMSVEDVYRAVKRKHRYNHDLSSYVTLHDIGVDPKLEDKIHGSILNKVNLELNIDSNFIAKSELLELALRPCLYRNMISPEPRHDIRVASTADLLASGFKVNEIVRMYRELGWTDWDEAKTRYQILHCKPINHKKRTLREIGACYNCGRSCK